MNKSQLIDMIRQEMGDSATKKDAALALSATLSAITKAVATEKVQIIGFGTFETKTRPARKGRDPRTGETLEIPASTSVVFRAASSLKD